MFETIGTGIHNILAIVHIKNGIARVLRRTVIARRQPYKDIPIVFEVIGMELFVTAELAIGRVHQQAQSV